MPSPADGLIRPSRRAPRKVLILGATGRVGGAALRALARLDIDRRPDIRVLARHPERLPMLDAAYDVHKGAIEDATSLDAALKGVDAVLLVTGDSPRQVDIECRVIDAATRAGRPHVVKVSAITAGMTPRASFGQTHGAIEDVLRRSGLSYTILRPTFFFQSLELFAEPVRRTKRLIAPAGDGPIAFIDVDDVGIIAARALVEPSPHNATYDLTGPAAWRLSEVAAALGDRLGHPVTYISPPLLLARAMMLAGGMSLWLSGQVTALFGAIRRGAEARVTGDAEQLLGRRLRDLHSYLDATLGTWSGQPVRPVTITDVVSS